MVIDTPTQTHVAVELRLTTAEADALAENVPVFLSMVSHGVWFPRGKDGAAQDLAAGLEKLVRVVGLRLEPFD